MRLFIAAELPATILDGLALLVEELKEEMRGPRWVRPDGIHLTLRFLGEVAQPDAGRLGLR